MLIMEPPHWPFTAVQQPKGWDVSRHAHGSPEYRGEADGTSVTKAVFDRLRRKPFVSEFSTTVAMVTVAEVIVFKGRHFDRSVILLCVRWYLAYSLSLRNLEEMMAERGSQSITRPFTDGSYAIRPSSWSA
jgi:hypothetical protein